MINIKHQYRKIYNWIELRRFQLLMYATILVLLIPAFSGTGRLSDLLFVVSMSFLFMQSMVVADIKQSNKRLVHYVVLALILIATLKPVGIDSVYIDYFKLGSFIIFFAFVLNALGRFIVRSKEVNLNVLMASVNIYFIAGIIGAFLALMLDTIYKDAYSFPAHIKDPAFVNYLYYSFITMSTVGYGDITPKIPQTQTLAYLISVVGQLYVAIIIAFLVGKLLATKDINEE